MPDRRRNLAPISRRPRRPIPPSVSLGGVVRERLPLPVVYYPNHYGTFFAFAEDEFAQPAICACALGPLQNLLRLKELFPDPSNVDDLRMVLLDNLHFPNVIASLPVRSAGEILLGLRIVAGLCHRCNLVPPSWRYCHEMYGTRFIQYFGWYVNQTYLRLGMRPTSFRFLPEACPPEVQQLALMARMAREEFQVEEQRLMAAAAGPQRPDIGPQEVTYWRNVRFDEATHMISLRRAAAQAERRLTKTVEDIVRQEFGFKRVGEGWISETLLYQLVTRLLPGREVLRHARPDWLDGMELDIFVPSLSLAFEYQGQQHFHAIKAWGGQRALEELIERDRRKAHMCQMREITLLAFHYTEPLTESHVQELLGRVGIQLFPQPP